MCAELVVTFKSGGVSPPPSLLKIGKWWMDFYQLHVLCAKVVYTSANSLKRSAVPQAVVLVQPRVHREMCFIGSILNRLYDSIPAAHALCGLPLALHFRHYRQSSYIPASLTILYPAAAYDACSWLLPTDSFTGVLEHPWLLSRSEKQIKAMMCAFFSFIVIFLVKAMVRVFFSFIVIFLEDSTKCVATLLASYHIGYLAAIWNFINGFCEYKSLQNDQYKYNITGWPNENWCLYFWQQNDAPVNQNSHKKHIFWG